ncbi:hypothetical protein AEGHOMDF_5345 [Methylobacterium soli]|nr:hypothetical protein AEGHOMDF_5345 [Methylobacterium soli]
MIEGSEAAVAAIFGRIRRDQRHRGVTVLRRGPAADRRFPGHAMVLVGHTRVALARMADQDHRVPRKAAIRCRAAPQHGDAAVALIPPDPPEDGRDRRLRPLDHLREAAPVERDGAGDAPGGIPAPRLRDERGQVRDTLLDRSLKGIAADEHQSVERTIRIGDSVGGRISL